MRSFSPKRAGVGEDLVEAVVRRQGRRRVADHDRPGTAGHRVAVAHHPRELPEVEPGRLGQALGLARGGEGDEVHEVAGQLGARARAGRAHVHDEAGPAGEHGLGPLVGVAVAADHRGQRALVGAHEPAAHRARRARRRPARPRSPASSSAVSGRIVEWTAMTVPGRGRRQQLGRRRRAPARRRAPSRTRRRRRAPSSAALRGAASRPASTSGAGRLRPHVEHVQAAGPVDQPRRPSARRSARAR